MRVARAFVIAIAVSIGGCAAFVAYGIAREVFGPPYGSDGPHSGWRARLVGDLDGDGETEIVLFTPFEAHGGSYGSARVVSSRSKRVLATFRRGESPLASADEIDVADDFDGDGDREFLVRADGGVLLLDLLHGDVLRRIPTDLSSVCGSLGDIDGDGRADLLVGGYPKAPEDVARVSAVSSRTGECLWTIEGRDARTSEHTTRPFAWNGIVVGDVDRDGVRDAVIDTESNRLRVVSGRDGSTLREIDASFYWINGSLAAPGDVDHDGAADLLFEPSWDTAPVRLVSLASGSELALLRPDQPWAVHRVAAPGDVDGDGTADLARVGGHRFWIHSGVDASEIALVGGSYCDGAVDVNGDGCADLLVAINVGGAEAEKLDDDEVWRSGKLRILSGRDRSVLLEVGGDDLEPVKR